MKYVLNIHLVSLWCTPSLSSTVLHANKKHGEITLTQRSHSLLFLHCYISLFVGLLFRCRMWQSQLETFQENCTYRKQEWAMSTFILTMLCSATRERPTVFWISCFSLSVNLLQQNQFLVRSVSKPFVRDTIPATYNGLGVTQSLTLWISSTSFMVTRRPERKAKSLPSSATYVKNTGRPRQKGTFVFRAEHRGRVGSTVILWSEVTAFVSRSGDGLLSEGCRGFIAF